MVYIKLGLQAVLLLASMAALLCAENKDKRQVGSALVNNEEDREAAETGFADAVHASSKYFQYAHVPAKDHYEAGHKRGNEHHFIERHEKAHPHAGEFKTKVRWGDKHGGYGEHYWDYNHAGHGHDGEGEESTHGEEYAAYDGSEQVPQVVKGRQRRNILSGDTEFISDEARTLVESGAASKHGGNYRREPSDVKRLRKRHSFGIDTESELYPANPAQGPVKFVNYDY